MSIELLAPAGSPEALDAAVGEGADAVYLGLKDFNARLRSANFTYAQFEGTLRALRSMKKKVYVTVNTVFEQREADRMYQFLKYLNDQQPDALIVQDFGVIQMVHSCFPSLRLHASTQMNIASARGANALSRFGVSRVVLARELSLNELKDIKTETNLELEVFVHGALCVSISGLCLFSSYLGGKSANRGMCTQACRRLYHRSQQLGKSESGGKDKISGGYFFSPNDLQLLESVPDLAALGIKAIKIEGRMKSASYVGAVVSAYRLVADAVESGDEDEIRRSVERGKEILKNDFARTKTQFLFDKADNIDWLDPQQSGGTGINLGTIQKIKGSGSERRALVTPQRGVTLSVRDSVRIHKSDDSGRVSVKLTYAEKQGNSYWISIPDEQISAGIDDHVYLIQTKEMRKRYAQVISNVTGGKGPGREKAPSPLQSERKKPSKKAETFPEGIYAAVSKPEDLFILQSSRPQRVMLELSRKNAKYLSSEKIPLPFKPAEIILNLDPWFPQTVAGYKNEVMADEIKQLTERGYYQYIVNNPGHFSMFRGLEKIKLIAGPWLYTFNSWSLSLISSLGVDGFVSPLENNRQNLEKTIGMKVRRKEEKNQQFKKGKTSSRMEQPAALQSKYFITVFSYPPLFNIRADVKNVLDLKSFSDNTDENFNLVTGDEGSRVYPEKYFSIIDKIPFLKEAGFKRFIIDLKGQPLKKTNYRDLMRTLNENSGLTIQPLPCSSRFNWKDGFYSV